MIDFADLEMNIQILDGLEEFEAVSNAEQYRLKAIRAQ